jgi:hypothetical protein
VIQRTPRELALFSVGLAALVAFVLWLSDGYILFTRPLWVDEWLTMYVTQRSSPVSVIGDLASGADGGASLFHLAVWGIRRIVAPLSPTALRAIALVCVFGALVLMYAVLRRRFSRDASVAGVLAVGSHRLIVFHEFEGRFYGPWLLCCVFYAWALSLNQRSGSSRRRDQLLLAVSAILLCTVHWYGVITLGLMAGSVVLSYGRRWRDGLRLIAPSVAGILALLIVMPLAIGESRALSVSTWVPDFEYSQVQKLVSVFWFSTVPPLATIALVAAVVISRLRSSAPAPTEIVRGALSDAGVLALLALALMPLALAVPSILGQPSMLDRYAIATLLAWGPWVALAMQLLGRWPARVFSALMAWFWFASYTRQANSMRPFAAAVHQGAVTLDRVKATHLPIVFQSINVMYAVVGENWTRDSSLFLDLSDSTLFAMIPAPLRANWFTKAVRVERDFARVHARRFGFPRLATPTALDTVSRFLLYVPEHRLPPGVGVEAFGRALFPKHRMTTAMPDLYLFQRQPTAR